MKHLSVAGGGREVSQSPEPENLWLTRKAKLFLSSERYYENSKIKQTSHIFHRVGTPDITA